MKCTVCGYKHNEPQEQGNGKLISDGEEKFIQLINAFHRKDEKGQLDEVYLFACPKCGTVRLEKW